MNAALKQAIKEGRDELTPEESEQYVEGESLKYLNMTIEEFRSRAALGILPEDNSMVVHIALLAGVALRRC